MASEAFKTKHWEPLIDCLIYSQKMKQTEKCSQQKINLCSGQCAMVQSLCASLSLQIDTKYAWGPINSCCRNWQYWYSMEWSTNWKNRVSSAAFLKRSLTLTVIINHLNWQILSYVHKGISKFEQHVVHYLTQVSCQVYHGTQNGLRVDLMAFM